MDDKCKHHVQCRADHARSPDMLCGYHHAKTWGWCIWWREYEYQGRLARAIAKVGRGDSGADESISEAIKMEEAVT